MDGNTCPACHTHVPYPAFICTGCQGHVIYGATSEERTTWFKLGFLIAFFGLTGLMLRFYHMSLEVLFMCAVGGVAGGFLGLTYIVSSKENLVRTFVR